MKNAQMPRRMVAKGLLQMRTIWMPHGLNSQVRMPTICRPWSILVARKRFEKHAQRREKEALLSIQDLDQGTFTDDTPQGRGPRDFTGSSWLDTDSVMDRYGDDFTPPNPSIGHVKISKLVFWVLLIAGVAGIIASAFMPALAGILGSIFGVCALIGAAGLIVQHKGHTQTRRDVFDDGARV